MYLDELKDLDSAETQMVKALPKMAKAASSDELRQGFEEHLEQTKGHVQRLEQIFQALGESPKGKKCKGMEDLVDEGAEVIDDDFEGSVKDAALIGAAQRVEHYRNRRIWNGLRLCQRTRRDGAGFVADGNTRRRKEN